VKTDDKRKKKEDKKGHKDANRTQWRNKNGKWI
jgi:hypothetical protein